MPDIIEWQDETGSQILWRHPKDRLSWGDYLTVRQNQVAVFMKDGKAFDVITPGSHLLKTDNIPLLTTVLSRIVGYEKDPFHAELIFIATSDFRGKFGGRSQTQELAPITYFGDYIYKVVDFQKFAFEIVSNRGNFTQEAFEEFFRTFFQQQLIAKLSQFSIVNLMQESIQTAAKTQEAVNKELIQFGIKLKKVNFASVDTTPEYRDRLFWMRSGVDASKLATYSGMKDVAANLPTGGAGGGALGMTAFLMPEMMRQAENAQPAAQSAGKTVEEVVMVDCNQCDAKFSPAAKFCSSCGDPTDDELKGTTKFCTNCGAKLDPSAKFCVMCGTKL
ncbi:MAG: SPFH domain-containing protein [Candidatus Kariarchaeum pelagius]|nr:SPFH domain-containing protein [archaeon]